MKKMLGGGAASPRTPPLATLLHAALRLAATFPMITCSCDCSISVLRRLKTYVRNTMSQERMNGLALLNVHREISVSAE